MQRTVLSAGTVMGPYQIVGPLGAGGMGVVYRARDPRLNREVAIKLLPSSFSADPERLRRFEQEALATSALNHPNILTIYDVGQSGGTPYFVAELLQGTELRAIMDGPIAPRRAIEIARQLAQGLAAAPMALSPDGMMLAFIGGKGGTTQLWVRSLAEPDAVPVPGTEVDSRGGAVVVAGWPCAGVLR